MITVVMLTKNSERTLSEVLTSVKNFEEVIIIDTGSTDKTKDIALSFPNVTYETGTLTHFGVLRNEAAKKAKNDWILALDSDEVLSKELQTELLTNSLSANTLYNLPFLNLYNNKIIKGCGWYPESHIRLYHRKMTCFTDSYIHEKIVEKDLTIKTLRYPVYHYSYLSIDDFLRKMQLYSDLFAKQNVGYKKASFTIALLHAIGTFFKSYFLKKGFLLGKEGAIISIYQTNVAFYKYLKLAEANKNVTAPPLSSDSSKRS